MLEDLISSYRLTPTATCKCRPAASLYSNSLASTHWHSTMSRRWQMKEAKTRMSEGGRLVIPVEFRKALGLKQGDEVVLALDDDGLRLMTMEQAIRRARTLVRSFVPEGVSLVDELLLDRREEAALTMPLQS